MDAQPAILSAGVLATFALAVGGIRLIARKDERTKGMLMLVAAVVLLANVLLWAWPMPARAARPLPPAPIQAYLDRAAGCEHWRGEEPYDPARAAVIARNVRESCVGLQAARKRLRRRYRDDRRLLALLDGPDA